MSMMLMGVGRADAGGLPVDTSGLQLWYDSDTITGLSNDDSMVTWLDSSGNGNTATLGTAPVYRTADIDSGPAVQGNGTTQYMDTGLAATANATLFAVFNGTAGGRTLIGSQSAAPNARSYLASDAGGLIAGGVGSQSFVTIKGTTNIVDSVVHITCLTYDGSTVKLYWNGDQEYSAAQASAASSLDWWIHGNDKDALLNNVWAGDTADIVVHNRALSQHEVAVQCVYFGREHGVTIPMVRDDSTNTNWGTMTSMDAVTDAVIDVPQVSGTPINDGFALDFDGTMTMWTVEMWAQGLRALRFGYVLMM